MERCQHWLENQNTVLKIIANNTRLTSFHLNIKQTQMSRTDIRRNFFSNRVISHWNNLPNYMKDLPNVNKFKAEYDKMLQ